MTEENNTEAAGRDPGAGEKKGIPKVFTYAIVIILILVLLAGAYVVINSKSSPPATGDEDEIPVPGHPGFFQKRIDAYYENQTSIYVTENRNATDPVYGRLISFLGDDATEKGVYEPGHECSSFAVELHDHAERVNIKAHLVLVALSNAPLHMVVGFNTTDRGMVYVDDTGLTEDEIDRSMLVSDRIVNLTVGSDYIRHILPPFDYDENPGMGTVTDFLIIS
ncbi:MAG: hypothetical protein WBZ29_10685 [Methanocella sp.]